VRQVGICLVSWVLAPAAFASLATTPEPRASRASRPYLTVVVAAPLRFEECPAPPSLPLKREATDDRARLNPTVSSTVASNPENPSKEPPPQDAALPPPGGVAATSAPTSPSKDKPGPPPPAILPDDTRPKVRAEDFLPFFQFPGSGANPSDVTVAPAPTEPGKLPPSTATYRQQ